MLEFEEQSAWLVLTNVSTHITRLYVKLPTAESDHRMIGNLTYSRALCVPPLISLARRFFRQIPAVNTRINFKLSI